MANLDTRPAARFNGAQWSPAAWVDNEWNGMVPGGYAIWGEFEAIMDQGMDHGERYWLAHGIPAGYGQK